MGQKGPVKFADADWDYDDSRFYIVGAPFDLTCCHRKGCSLGPKSIRVESWNFETYFPDYGFDLIRASIHDGGDIKPAKKDTEMVQRVHDRISKALSDNKFTVLMGGEHSVTVGALKAYAEKYKDLYFISLDAHLDYRDGYEGYHFSHAAVCRRVADIIGPGNIAEVGIRSYSAEEAEVLKKEKGHIVVSNIQVHSDEKASSLKGPNQLPEYIYMLKRVIGDRPLYVTLDIDAIDPAFAPGVGTPEPFGMTPWAVRDLLRALIMNMVGFDLTEVDPKCDNGNTAALAARMIREVIALKHLSENP